MEFRPLVHELGFRRPQPDDPRARKPRPDEADYAEKLRVHNAFLMERDVYREVQYIRDAVTTSRFSPLLLRRRMVQMSSVTLLGIFADHEMRKKYRIISAEGYPLHGQYIAGADQCLVHSGLPREDPSVHRRPREGFQEQFCSQGEVRPDRL